jgi:SAM-dependent methyltransferase
MQTYPNRFFERITEGSRSSAREIVPLVLELMRPRHVVDVGCGLGTWLSVFRDYGVDDVVGVDGDYVDRGKLEIPEERYMPHDLTKPLRMRRKFDLVVSLEVAEHLPGKCAGTFVDSLTRLGPVILFSAAIPFQGGTNHVNEQWPDYWRKRFQEKGYVAIDCLRRKIWQNENVAWWYAQNILVFAKQNYLEDYPLLKKEFEVTATSQLSIVHPKRYIESVEWAQDLLSVPQDLAGLIPAEESVILVDQNQLGDTAAMGRRTIPFLERDGQYWGAPPDDETAIRELERLRRRSGAGYIIFAWPAFWWLDYYSGLSRYLRSKFHCVLENDRLVVYDLRT